MKLTLVAAAGLGLVACATALPAVDELALERARARDPEVTLADLEAGRTRYRSACGRCHQVYEPTARTVAEWRHDVAEMSPLAALTPEDQRQVLRYLEAFARH